MYRSARLRGASPGWLLSAVDAAAEASLEPLASFVVPEETPLPPGLAPAFWRLLPLSMEKCFHSFSMWMGVEMKGNENRLALVWKAGNCREGTPQLTTATRLHWIQSRQILDCCYGIKMLKDKKMQTSTGSTHPKSAPGKAASCQTCFVQRSLSFWPFRQWQQRCLDGWFLTHTFTWQTLDDSLALNA